MTNYSGDKLTLNPLRFLLRNITYKNWKFNLSLEGKTRFLQIVFLESCACGKGGVYEHRCHKWRVSTRITESEFVQLVFSAVRQAEEHEMRENFQYKKASVFGPHFDVNSLVKLYEGKDFDMNKL